MKRTIFTFAHRKAQQGFSLIEVVLSLAITAFTLVALLALFATGLQTTKESDFEINAANLASSLISTRRDMPTNYLSKDMKLDSGRFILPPMRLEVGRKDWPSWPSATNTIEVMTNGIKGQNVVDEGGYTNQGFTPYYRIGYHIQTNDLGVSSLYLSITQPANITNQDLAPNRYEILTYIRTP